MRLPRMTDGALVTQHLMSKQNLPLYTLFCQLYLYSKFAAIYLYIFQCIGYSVHWPPARPC